MIQIYHILDKLVDLYEAHGDNEFMYRDALKVGFKKKEFFKMLYSDVVRVTERYRQPVRRGKRQYIPTKYRLRGDIVNRIKDHMEETQLEMQRLKEEMKDD
jgi:hypothetical protein